LLRIYSSPKERIFKQFVNCCDDCRMRWLNIESLVTVGQLPSLSDLLGCTTEYTHKFKGLGHNCRGLETHQVLMPYNKTEDNFDKMSLEDQESEITDD
jgi:hypothetical protein